ncbi:histidine kinase,histidine kinase,CHASE domain-containing protein [Candidatus Methanoperedens nitroreducens]|uniref:histidine kinase n=1 Tax=Candidatus Methanoperedens nitratireducens TaxID=1392998 RepID=A0A062UZG3_9EURY|nr:ATP-binding protein [Candidatus Methanoperedens nitroreducens]KCZ72316.1 histidine kinase,histidine kinase,CHASE domain-containing protein [Candidatus Methanoperedens nitroreducens]MDJ1420782.1 ATP-binding protein [Candidatus Methanoperedens sp.]
MLDKSLIRKTKLNWLTVLIICLLSITIIVFLGIKSNDEIQNIVEKQFSERQLLLSKQISAGMREFLNEKTTIIEVMALHISDASSDVTLTEFKNVYNKTDGIYVFEFLNESGVVTIGYPEENTPFGYDLYKFDRPGDSETERILVDTFEWVRDRKETNITRPVRLLEGGLGAFIWTPVYKGDEFKGVILAIITVSDISNKFMRNYDSPWEIHLVDDRGAMLYHAYKNNKDLEYLDALNSTDPLLQYIFQDQINGREGTGYYFEGNGSEKKLIAYSPIVWRNQNFSISVVSPASEINALINSVYEKQGLFVGVAIGFIVLGSFSIVILLSRWNKSLELEVARKTSELNESNKLLQDANKRLKELDKSKSDFLSMVSHELKTPLTAMKVSSEFLLEDDSKLVTRKELIQIIIKNIDRLTRLVNDLLDISMIESGELRFSKEIVDLHDIIDIAVGTVKNQYEKKELNITTDIPKNLSKINADKDRIVQVFVNVLSNALRFTPEGGNVEIRACEFEECIEVHVKDDGVGIPPDKIDKIFDKFYRINTTSTRSHNGAGLGLAITRGIMEGHGGSIRAQSTPAKGSVFILTFNKNFSDF